MSKLRICVVDIISPDDGYVNGNRKLDPINDYSFNLVVVIDSL